MHRLVPCVILLAASSSLAQPRGAAKVPMRAVPCYPQDGTLHTTGADAVICWDKGCMKLDFENTDATWIVKPPTPKTWSIPQAEVKDDQICVGGKCKKLGKKLLAAIAEYKKTFDPANNGPLRLSATTDLKAFAIGYDQLWNVAGDSKLKLTTPKSYARSIDKPTVVGLEVAGDLMVVSWSACAGPCTTFSIVDSSGRPKGAEGDGGGGVFQLDNKRFVVVSEYAAMSILDLGTAKFRGSVKLGANPEQNSAVRGDDTTIFSMFVKNDGVQVVKVTAYDENKLLPSIESSMYLPNCKP